MTLEDGMAFPLYGKELAGYGIREGEELADAGYEEILHSLLPKRARRKALELLRSMDRTEAQLRRKLSDARYPDEIVEDAVAYVKSYHYVDDVRYAASYLEHHRDDRSLRQMEQTLYQRGITREVFEQAAALTDPVPEERQILAWAKKRGFVRRRRIGRKKSGFSASF